MSDNPNSPEPATTVQLAAFPTCSECGIRKVPRMSDAAVRVEVGDLPAIKLRKGEMALFMRLLRHVYPMGVLKKDLCRALDDSDQASKVLARLRDKNPNMLGAEKRQKTSGKGTFKVFYLPSNVTVIDLKAKEGSRGAS